MKIVKGLATFALVGVILGSCFDPPEYSNQPEITFKNIEFVEVGDFSDADTLIFTFDFRDGDGNLGLSPSELDPPYHDSNYFSGDGAERVPVASRVYANFTGLKWKSSGKTPRTNAVLDTPPAGGRILTLNDQIDYGLPPNQAPYTCPAYYQAYVTDTLLFFRDYASAIPPSTIVDTVLDVNNEIFFYAALTTWYIEPNPGYTNIVVDFLVKQPDGSFAKFDFREEFCTTFDGRFPDLTDKPGRALEGTMKYRMQSTGFLSLFSIETLKIEIRILDRDLNPSNVISTGEFTLNDIRR